MIYLDTSVALAEVFSEKRRPPPAFWSQKLGSSRLLEYEIAVRLNVHGRPARGERTARAIVGQSELFDLSPLTLARALQPFPVSVRTLDAIHLSTMVFLQGRGITIELATYDSRLAQAATAMGIALASV